MRWGIEVIRQERQGLTQKNTHTVPQLIEYISPPPGRRKRGNPMSWCVHSPTIPRTEFHLIDTDGITQEHVSAPEVPWLLLFGGQVISVSPLVEVCSTPHAAVANDLLVYWQLVVFHAVPGAGGMCICKYVNSRVLGIVICDLWFMICCRLVFVDSHDSHDSCKVKKKNRNC